MKSILSLLLLCTPVFGQLAGQLEGQFPDAPEPVKQMPYGGWAHDKLGEPKNSPVFSRTFVAAHAVWLASNVFDIEMTHQGLAHHNCLEGGFDGNRHPPRGEMYLQDMNIFALLSTFDWLVQRGHPPKAFKWIPYLNPAYGTVQHLRGGIAWYNSCW